MKHPVVEEIIVNNEWREKEFSKFKTNSQNVDEALWLRMCIPMIYAHWEGYVLDSFRIMLKHLNSLQLKHDQTITNLTVFGLGSTFSSLAGKQNFEQKIIFTNKFYALISGVIKFGVRVDTKSNLRSSVLKDLCAIFCFDYGKFENFIADIDRLVDVRNAIAHGENSIVPDKESLQRYIESITRSTDILLFEIDDFLVNKKYLCLKN